MITPGLLRRSLVRAANWRLLLLQLVLLLVPGFAAVHPFAEELDKLLAHLPGEKALGVALGSRGLTEVLMAMQGPGSLHPENGLLAGLLLSILCGAIFSSAVLAVAASDEPLSSRELLAGAGRYYGRVFRMIFAGLIPIALCGAVVAGLFKWSGSVGDKAITEAAATHAARFAIAGTLLLLVVMQSWIDAARALFVAQPARRSAFLAVFAGGWLLLRRPLRSLAIGLFFGALSLLLAGAAMIARQQLVQSGVLVLVAWLFAQLARALLAWGAAGRLLGFVELARADALARAKPAGTFEMAPPLTSPPPLAPIPPDIAEAVGAAFEMIGPDEKLAESVALTGEPSAPPAPREAALPEAIEPTASSSHDFFEPPHGAGSGGGEGA